TQMHKRTQKAQEVSEQSSFFVLLMFCLVPFVFLPRIGGQSPADLTGNWVIREPQADGTSRNTYLDLKQEGSRITGTIRLTQFYYKISESPAAADGFTLIGSMMDGRNERRVTYEVKPAGDELRVTTRANANAAPVERIARRAPAGEGAFPARLPLPALHR